MTTFRSFFMLLTLLLPMAASAHNFVMGQRVPPVAIADKGELLWQQNKFSYQSWNSTKLPGKIRVLQHIAGRTSSKEKNAALIEAIKAAKFPRDHYQTTTLINTDDAIPGTGMLVRSNIENNKKQFPWSQFIVDNNGVAKKVWQLEDEGSAVVVLDKAGRVRFAKDGALTADEIQHVITLVKQLMQQDGTNE
ncbi:YtfJ family protein [Erwinia psidii]|uniref:YtfJ family protein n=1 Tax=Erwinia psidii TaxID=69224 RepID=A0A3N6SK70_9GAMM|nr:YtfJ family protein [Erwinia psidii]MCX8958255.1 YtfJ family protein [Erwinia psidii]MCX8962397.1 YtfJ family protein [Erwinia psidii]MCX8965181.1 YtfJ family protein [Erwinia psidii]RQM38016.1 YtfJ family protein [Erwinia psidii]